ncbi:PREDICTED: interleukin-32 isoform X1 [Hipposideros armiger]|uniref:Interleukin-32 isoform X1 n=1 Tax=Hipposideros armiger TaxID=186990 RepID=A0A8B7QJS3_HIPAR|nr:PREDICTED: interleukin-32 isoform X1 [Hipposideros armiger]
MCYSKIAPEKIEKLRTNMHSHVDSFCDGLGSKGENQVRLELEKMEDQVCEDLHDVVEAECQNINQESAPLLLKEVQELRIRNRCREQTLDLETESPAAQQADETFFQKVRRLFQEMLQRLKGMWQKLWDWMKEKLAGLCSAMKSVWNMIERLFFNVVESFKNVFQDKGTPQSLVELQPHLGAL